MSSDEDVWVAVTGAPPVMSVSGPELGCCFRIPSARLPARPGPSHTGTASFSSQISLLTSSLSDRSSRCPSEAEASAEGLQTTEPASAAQTRIVGWGPGRSHCRR